MSEYFEFQIASRGRSSEQISQLDKNYYFNKNEANDRNRALLVLKDMIGASVNLVLKDKSCCEDDDFLMRFLFARKFICNEAFQLLINYHSYKQRNKNLLRKLTVFDESIQRALRDGFPTILRERDRRGRKMIVYFPSNWNPILYSLETIYRSLLLSLETLLEDNQNKSQGFVIIVDWTNFTMRQSSYLNPKTLKIMIEGLQDCFPVRFKAIHFIGQPWYVEAALAFIKPFIKARNKIILHGTNLSTLHEKVAKDILPTELGGEGQSLNPLDWYHELIESSQKTEIQKTYVITEAMIYSKPLPKLEQAADCIQKETGDQKIIQMSFFKEDNASDCIIGVCSDS